MVEEDHVQCSRGQHADRDDRRPGRLGAAPRAHVPGQPQPQRAERQQALERAKAEDRQLPAAEQLAEQRAGRPQQH
jgi:hypothetical protein